MLSCNYARPETSMHARHFVFAVRVGTEWYQGIGKTTREAKFNAAAYALSKMKAILPGEKVKQ